MAEPLTNSGEAPPPAGPMQRSDGAVAMLDGSGEPVWVPADQARAALGQGFRLESAQMADLREKKTEYAGAGQMALTGVEALGRGASLGLTDVVAGAIDPEVAATMDERRQFNPGIALGGELIGAAAPALFTGGAGGAASLARMTPAGLVARGGLAAERGVASAAKALGLAGESTLGRAGLRGLEMAAGGAVEGAAYGLGSAASEASLTNTDLTAEKLLVGGLEGLELGALAGGALGSGGSLLGSATGGLRALGRADAALPGGAQAAGGAERGFLQRELDELANRQTLKALGLQGSDVTKLRGKLGEEGLDAVSRRLHDEGLISAADDLTERAVKVKTLAKDAGQRVEESIKRADAEGGTTPTALSVMQRIRTDIIDSKFGKDALTRAANEELIKKLETKVLGPLTEADAAGGMSLESLWKFRQKVDKMAGHGKEFSALTGGEEAMQAVRDVIEEEIEKAIAAKSPDIAAAYKSGKDDYKQFGNLSRLSSKRAGMEEGNRFFSLSDNLMMAGGAGAALMSGDPETMAGAAALGLANRFARTRGTVAAAKVARRLADVNQRRTTAVRALFDETAPKPKALKARAELVAGADQIQQAARLGLLSTGDASALPVAVETPGDSGDFPFVVSSVQQAVADPIAYSERIGAQLGDLAHDEPTLADAVIRTALGDADYLAAHAPAGYTRADGASLTPMAEAQQIPRHAMESFMRRVTALKDPVSVAEALANGELNLEGIDALKMRRPQLYQEMRAEIIEGVSAREKPLPFSRRMVLGLAFEFPADRSLEPGYGARIQQDYAAAAQAAQKKSPPAPPPERSQGAQAAMTPAQKLARGA